MQLNALVQPGAETLPSRVYARVCLGISAGLIVYVLGYVLWFLGSPLGRFPLLDSAENLQLARQIADGTLPPEPFFRAMLYPAVLSLFLRLGISPESLPAVAGVFGGCCHLFSTLMIFQIARRGWANVKAGVWAATLFGFNPVAVYFAAEPLDTTLGMFLFLAGLNVLHREWTAGIGSAHSVDKMESSSRRVWGSVLALAGAGALWGLAMLARPHYAIVLAGMPFLLLIWLWRKPSLLSLAAGAFGLSAAILLLVAGTLQKQVTGQFRIMPTQGAYSLWAGNRPGANGRYFEQQIHLAASEAMEGDNPARIESRLLFQREIKADSPIDPDAETRFWRKKTLTHIVSNPGEWISLMGKKVYFLFNDFEQYNNKTYAVQKALAPPLKLNPLGWGLTLVICAAGLALNWRRAPEHETAGSQPGRFRGGLLVAVTAAFYAAGVVLFFVSDRFRLPLLPFLCVGAGSWGLLAFGKTAGRGESPRRVARARLLPVGISVAIAVLTFSRAFGVHDLTPAAQDYVALSIATGKAGEDLDSLSWARRALAERPSHAGALACAVNAYFNCRLRGTEPEQVYPDESWQLQIARVGRIPQPAPGLRLVQAIALWKTSSTEQASSALRALCQTEPTPRNTQSASDDALGVLLLTGLQNPEEEARARSRAPDTASSYLLAALARREGPGNSSIPPSRRQMVEDLAPFVRQIFP